MSCSSIHETSLPLLVLFHSSTTASLKRLGRSVAPRGVLPSYWSVSAETQHQTVRGLTGNRCVVRLVTALRLSWSRERPREEGERDDRRRATDEAGDHATGISCHWHRSRSGARAPRRLRRRLRIVRAADLHDLGQQRRREGLQGDYRSVPEEEPRREGRDGDRAPGTDVREARHPAGRRRRPGPRADTVPGDRTLQLAGGSGGPHRLPGGGLRRRVHAGALAVGAVRGQTLRGTSTYRHLRPLLQPEGLRPARRRSPRKPRGGLDLGLLYGSGATGNG